MDELLAEIQTTINELEGRDVDSMVVYLAKHVLALAEIVANRAT